MTHAQRLCGMAADDATMKRLKQAFPSAAETLPTGAKPLFSYEDEDPIEAFFRSAHPHRGSYPCPTSQPISGGAPLPAPDITFKRVAVKQKQPCRNVVTDSDDHTTLPPPEMDLRNAPGWGAYAANASVANASSLLMIRLSGAQRLRLVWSISGRLEPKKFTFASAVLLIEMPVTTALIFLILKGSLPIN